MAAVLLLVDIQKGLDDPKFGARNNPDAELKAGALLAHWRAANAPVIHVQHMSVEPDSPLRPGLPGNALKPEVTPGAGEVVIRKEVNSAFIGTDLLNRLRDMGATDLVICGLTTPHCVSTTARMAANLGFNVELAEDACAAFAASADMSWKPGATAPSPEVIHDLAVAHISGEFVTVVSTETLLGRLP